MKYKGFDIVPKKDFGPLGYLSNGKVIRKGWLACRDGVDVMPGATWFHTPKQAKHAIDVYIEVGGDADRFWEIMQPFEYWVGKQVDDTKDGEIQQGRFTAIIENHRVVDIKVRPRKPKSNEDKTHYFDQYYLTCICAVDGGSHKTVRDEVDSGYWEKFVARFVNGLVHQGASQTGHARPVGETTASRIANDLIVLLKQVGVYPLDRPWDSKLYHSYLQLDYNWNRR